MLISRKNVDYVVIDINLHVLIVVIILQYIQISNHYVYTWNYRDVSKVFKKKFLND